MYKGQVGALTSTAERFKARPWDLKSTRATCNGCSMGCSIELNSSQNKMLRILGVDNDAVNQGWLCDKGRYNFEYLNSDSRLKTPLKKIDNELVEIAGPNCEKIKHRPKGNKTEWNLITRKDIKAGEELTLHYTFYKPE